ncbi:DUF2252 family protein [Humitalea sp. 24SJ18S-53]|uniref:DUF2252 family protein n=1 Tax=Humitalea sp. 24SJ18S-53 TaxID=3422307 RepID=UPI003D67F22B
MTGIVAATEANEAWLRGQLGAETVEADLRERRRKMAKDPFTFLRAAYWRWVQVLPAVWRPAVPGTVVLAVGDIHLENFGTWRDAEGRLAWGVNDFDEAAEMPWPLDLLRLATSAHLAVPDAAAAEAGAPARAAAIMAGYVDGLKAPAPIVLDLDFAWLRAAVMAERSEKAWRLAEDTRSAFWHKMSAPAGDFGAPPSRLRAALEAAMPAGAVSVGLWPRSAGAGSLGRPRWVMRATWHGGPVLREAKAMLPSAWAAAHAGTPLVCRAVEAARGAHRATDPCLAFRDGVAVRRLSPNNAKFEVDEHPELLLSADMLRAMGRDIAGVHAATAGAVAAILDEIALGAPLDAAGAALAGGAMALARAIQEDQAAVPPEWRKKKKKKDGG